MANITPEQYSAKLKKLTKGIAGIRGAAEAAGIKTLEGLMKDRIFTDHLNTAGRSFGPYRSPAYKRRRARPPFGLQTAVKDLEFSGQLRRDLITGQSKGHAALGFITDRSAVVAAAQEGPKQIGTFIWRPQSDELKKMLNAMITTINKRIVKALR